MQQVRSDDERDEGQADGLGLPVREVRAQVGGAEGPAGLRELQESVLERQAGDGPARQAAQIVGNPDYSVYADGRVYSSRRGVFLKPSIDPAGYRVVKLGRRTWLLHRLVALAFLPEPKPGQKHVRHLDGDPGNNVVENLAWGTAKDNAADMIRHGRMRRRESHNFAKLTWAAVDEIRTRLATTDQTVLAKEYGVHKVTISKIARGLLWQKDGVSIRTAPLTSEERTARAKKAASRSRRYRGPR